MKNERVSSAREMVKEKIKRRTFISFSIFSLASASGITLWNWFRSLPRNNNDLPEISRKVLYLNERFNNNFFSNKHLATTYPKSKAAASPRVNGDLGIKSNFDSNLWKLDIEIPHQKTISLTLKDLMNLPKTEIVFDFKCIEGWDQIVYYGGVKFTDLMSYFSAITHSNHHQSFAYVGLETPDQEYYVGIDMKSMIHPQTILCYEMSGKPLTMQHGAPLRLIIPTKYGIKNLKRIGKMFFSNNRPRDYWFERGYDYDAAL